MANQYTIGATVKMTATFKNASSVNTDPTTVTCIVKTPAGVETTYTYALTTVDKDATGIYSKTITTAENGTYQYYFKGTGTVADAGRGFFLVMDEFA